MHTPLPLSWGPLGSFCNDVQYALNKLSYATPERLGQFVLGVLGVTDALDCTHGHASGCFWSALAIIPFGRVSRGAKLAKDASELRATANAADDIVSSSRWVRGEFKGARVYQRDDLIDLSRVDRLGRTNLERMKKGLAPIDHDGNPINLHHLTQAANSPLVELPQSLHQDYSAVLHINPTSVPSGIDRNAFANWRSQYWKARARDFG